MSALRAALLTLETGGTVDDDMLAMLLTHGLIAGSVMQHANHRMIVDPELTRFGYDVLDLMRSEAIWNSVSARVRETTGTTTLQLWLDVLTAAHRKALTDAA